MHFSVLHIVAPAAVGGLERVVQTLALGHSRRGHRVTVGVIAIEGASQDIGQFISTFDGHDVAIATVTVTGRGYWKERTAIRALCQRLHPQIVHTHGYRTDVIDGTAACGQGFPTVTTVHGFTGGGWKNQVYETLHRRALRRRFDAVVAVSRPLGHRLLANGVPANRLHVIPNAYNPHTERLTRDDARRVLGIPGMQKGVQDSRERPAIVVGWVGRLSREKGLDVLIEALPLLRERNLTLAVCGDGPERAALEAQAAALGVSSMIRWCGIVPDAQRVFPGFDLFVLSSRTEGTPIALFEAMNARVPVVTTAVGGVPDVVTPNQAWLVPAENPAMLAAAVERAVADPDGVAMRVEAAQRRLQDTFALEPWLDAYERVYAAVAATQAA